MPIAYEKRDLLFLLAISPLLLSCSTLPLIVEASLSLLIVPSITTPRTHHRLRPDRPKVLKRCLTTCPYSAPAAAGPMRPEDSISTMVMESYQPFKESTTVMGALTTFHTQVQEGSVLGHSGFPVSAILVPHKLGGMALKEVGIGEELQDTGVSLMERQQMFVRS